MKKAGIDETYFKMKISDVDGGSAARGLNSLWARTLADKHREARRRRAELRTLAQGEVAVGTSRQA